MGRYQGWAGCLRPPEEGKLVEELLGLQVLRVVEEVQGVLRVGEWQNMEQQGQKWGETRESKVSMTKKVKTKTTKANYEQRVEH